MNKKLNTALCLMLALNIFSSLPLAAISYTGLGEITALKRDNIGNGLTYSHLSSVEESGKTQSSYIFEYEPSKGGVLPIVRWGNTVYGMDRLGSLVEAEVNEGKTVLGAVNGDFYSMQTGVPLSIMIDGGRIISSDDSKYAIGFRSDGSAVIGKPQVKINLTADDGAFVLPIDQLNKYPTIWGIYMFTSDFAKSTMSAAESLEIVIHLDGEIMANGTVSGVIAEVKDGTSNTDIPEGCAVISVALSHDSYSLLKSLTVGKKIQLNTSCEEGWDAVTTAIGGGDLILENGKMPDGIIDGDHEKVSNPRTAVGIKADGTVVFFAVEGRSTSARGLKLDELSAVMSELGCVSAVNLDGGGSTTVMVKPSDKSECAYISAPIGSNYRSVANGILFVSRHESDGKPAALSLSPNTPYILRGSTVRFSAQVLDSAYMPLDEYIAPDGLMLSFAGKYDCDAGTVSGGTYTAGMEGGEYRLTASNGKLNGEISVIVADTLDSLEVSPKRTHALPGDTVKLTIEGKYKNNTVLCDSGSFYYTINGEHILPNAEEYPDAMIICDLGYIDKSGSFHVFDTAVEGEVEIGVWFDQFVRYVKIKIGNAPETIADFETMDQFSLFGFNSKYEGATASPVGVGYRSGGGLALGFSYTDASLDTVAELKPSEPIFISTGTESIRLWAYGDISGILRCVVSDENGSKYELSYNVTKDYSMQIGWREISAVIPESLRTTALYLDTLLLIADSGTSSRSIVIDSPRIYYGKELPPSISGLESHWAAYHVYNLYDREVIKDDDCETVDGKLYYDADKALTRGEFAKILTLWYGIDAMTYANADIILEDSTPIDKLPYIRAAIAEGLMSGRGTNADGSIRFDSNALITRQEAFKVIGSRLAVSETALKFADSADVADWAVSGVSKCIASGVVGGYPDNTLRPQNSISRAELAAMLSKIR